MCNTKIIAYAGAETDATSFCLKHLKKNGKLASLQNSKQSSDSSSKLPIFSRNCIHFSRKYKKMSQTIENSLIKTDKISPERSSEKPINNNIKERLNLHVKRRLQESGADISLLNNNNTTKNSNTNNNNNEIKVRKQYTKRIEKANNPTIVRRAKRTKLKLATTSSTVSKRDSESIGSVASTSTTTASAGDDEGSRDGNSQNPDILHSPREKEKCPDLLNVVLNVKKRALFQNPEVIKFLHNMMDVLRQ